MTVYVDDMYLFQMGRYRGMKMSHLIADTVGELHEMADMIGVARKWFQNTTSGPHYDVAISKRALAIAKGAVPITLRQCAAMSALKRHGLPMGPPETAEARRRAMALKPTSDKDMAFRKAAT